MNPVAQRRLEKCLRVVAQKEGYQPSAKALAALAVNSGGDIRAAINALQFFCLNNNGSADAPYAATVAATEAARKPAGLSIGSRDLTLSIFHAIGKIIYAKRLPCSEDRSTVDPTFRAPLKCLPEEVVDKLSILAPMFLSFVHENYLSLFTDIADVAGALSYLSLADTFAPQAKVCTAVSLS
eukprot:TRINITY_DN538_c1_g1_i6.p1 TRINITY_DN538_c1_g1~~TRINITY_DN538_c1_g1_i6.p1  ORF type:complete len:182 (+),score=45.39 TRINITY_DN538_c1_g1_i6:531-1076(+)